MDLLCIIKWILYVFAGITLILSIVQVTIDQHENKDQIELAENPNSFTGKNIFIMLIMVVSTAPTIWHYFSPRPVWFIVTAGLSIIYFICRLAMPRHVHWEFQWPVLVTLVCSGIYLYLVYRNKSKDESIVTTFWKPIDGRESGGSSSSADSSGSKASHKDKHIKKKSSKATKKADT